MSPPLASIAFMSCEEHVRKKAKAIELRLAGYSRAQIMSAIGVTNNRSITRWLEGVPSAAWTNRHRAKDELREQAIEMRRQGFSYNQILSRLRVSKSSLSLWLRNVPLTEEQVAELARRQALGSAKRAATLRARRIERERSIMDTAAAQIGSLTPRELFLMGVIAYWAEGSKAKPWHPSPSMSFINSDPEMIKLYLRWLDLLGIERSRLIFRLNIHVSADIEAATAFWMELVDAPPSQFRRPTLKAHNPKTVRRKAGIEYVGCLTITVRRGLGTYRQVAGWFEGIMTALGAGVAGIARGALDPEDRVRTLGAQLCIPEFGLDPQWPEQETDTVKEPRGEYECRRTA